MHQEYQSKCQLLNNRIAPLLKDQAALTPTEMMLVMYLMHQLPRLEATFPGLMCLRAAHRADNKRKDSKQITKI